MEKENLQRNKASYTVYFYMMMVMTFVFLIAFLITRYVHMLIGFFLAILGMLHFSQLKKINEVRIDIKKLR